VAIQAGQNPAQRRSQVPPPERPICGRRVSLRTIGKMRFLRAHLFACIAVSIGLAIMVGIYFTNFDLFDSGLQRLLRIENNEVDEFVSVY
jgi:hypothetical protein